MCLVPVADGTVEAGMPVKGKEEHGTIVEVCENVNAGVNHTAEDEGQPSMSARADFVHEAPEQDGVNKQGGRRVQKIVGCDPRGIIEISGMDDVLHYTAGVLLKNGAIVHERSPRKQTERQVRQHRTPQKGGSGKFEFRAESLFNDSVDDKVGGDSVHRWTIDY